ncbi:MAG: metallophosphoesterase family protein [Gemmatimonadales bacterium]
MTAGVPVVHLGDIHFGRDVDLVQIEALEALIPTLSPGAIVLSGDLTQRARHGEFQRALAFAKRLADSAPVYTIPGNHDVEWWKSPFGIFGTAPLYRKYRRYFGDELAPVLTIPGAVIVGALTAHGIASGSMTWNLNDMAVKGHLPGSEVGRVRRAFAAAPAGAARYLVLHHNVLRGEISRRMGLARWKRAQRRLESIGADVVLCGHDHQEGAGQIGRVVVSTASTHTERTRGQRAAAFNVIRVDPDAVDIRHHRWDSGLGRFASAGFSKFARALPA